MLYIPWVLDVHLWEGCDEPPVSVEPLLLDLCQCPSKDGNTVTGVVQKQLQRVGLFSFDVVSGTG